MPSDRCCVNGLEGLRKKAVPVHKMGWIPILMRASYSPRGIWDIVGRNPHSKIKVNHNF